LQITPIHRKKGRTKFTEQRVADYGAEEESWYFQQDIPGVRWVLEIDLPPNWNHYDAWRVVGRQARPYNDKPRTYPIDLGETGTWHDRIDVVLPAG
jgi:hypothetical protein